MLLGAEGFWTSEVLKGLDTVTISLLCLGIAPTLYAQIAQALLTGLGRIPYVSAVRVAVSVANPILLIPVVVITNDPDWAVGAWLVVMTGNALALGVYVFRRVGRPVRPHADVLRRVVSFGTRGYVGHRRAPGLPARGRVLHQRALRPRPGGHLLARLRVRRADLPARQGRVRRQRPEHRGARERQTPLSSRRASSGCSWR